MIKKKKITTISKIWQFLILWKSQSQPVRGGGLRHGRGGGKTIKICKENNFVEKDEYEDGDGDDVAMRMMTISLVMMMLGIMWLATNWAEMISYLTPYKFP